MQLPSQQELRSVLSQLSLRQARLAVEIMLVVLIAVQTARLVWAVIVPLSPLGDWRTPVSASPVLPEALRGFDPFFPNATDAGPANVTALGLTLLGTRVDMVSGRGAAIVATGDGVQASFLVGEAVMPGVRLAAVDFDNVTLDRGGVREKLYIDQSATGAPVVTMADPQMTGSRVRGLAGEVVLTPRIRDGAVTGFMVSPNGSGEAFRAAGLRSGDVVLSVDGTPVAQIGEAAAVLARLGNSGSGVMIERDGKPMALRAGSN